MVKENKTVTWTGARLCNIYEYIEEVGKNRTKSFMLA